jgi:hypothetical protein
MRLKRKIELGNVSAWREKKCAASSAIWRRIILPVERGVFGSQKQRVPAGRTQLAESRINQYFNPGRLTDIACSLMSPTKHWAAWHSFCKGQRANFNFVIGH